MPLKRTGFKRKAGIKAPMARTGMLRPASFNRLKAETPAPQPEEHQPRPELAPRKRMKSTRPVMTPIRKSARGEDCTLLIAGVCNRDPATTVLCHSNQLEHGKGLGLKAPDTRACYGCSACHDVLDGRRPRPAWMTAEQLLDMFDRAMTITHEKLQQKGLM
jgi:hypothetical protein